MAGTRATLTLKLGEREVRYEAEREAVEAEGDRSHPLRLTGPAVETISFDAELDATDQLEFPDQHQAAVETGLLPAL